MRLIELLGSIPTDLVVDGELQMRPDVARWLEQAKKVVPMPKGWEHECDHCTMSPNKWPQPRFWRGLIDLRPVCDEHDWHYALGRLLRPNTRRWRRHKELSDNLFFYRTWWRLRGHGWPVGYCNWFAGRRWLAVEALGKRAMTGALRPHKR